MQSEYVCKDGRKLQLRGLKRSEVRSLRAQGHRLENITKYQPGMMAGALTEEEHDKIFALTDAVLKIILGNEADGVLEGDAVRMFPVIFSLTYPTEDAEKNLDSQSDSGNSNPSTPAPIA